MELSQFRIGCHFAFLIIFTGTGSSLTKLLVGECHIFLQSLYLFHLNHSGQFHLPLLYPFFLLFFVIFFFKYYPSSFCGLLAVFYCCLFLLLVLAIFVAVSTIILPFPFLFFLLFFIIFFGSFLLFHYQNQYFHCCNTYFDIPSPFEACPISIYIVVQFLSHKFCIILSIQFRN